MLEIFRSWVTQSPFYGASITRFFTFDVIGPFVQPAFCLGWIIWGIPIFGSAWTRSVVRWGWRRTWVRRQGQCLGVHVFRGLSGGPQGRGVHLLGSGMVLFSRQFEEFDVSVFTKRQCMYGYFSTFPFYTSCDFLLQSVSIQCTEFTSGVSTLNW